MPDIRRGVGNQRIVCVHIGAASGRLPHRAGDGADHVSAIGVSGAVREDGAGSHGSGARRPQWVSSVQREAGGDLRRRDDVARGARRRRAHRRRHQREHHAMARAVEVCDHATVHGVRGVRRGHAYGATPLFMGRRFDVAHVGIGARCAGSLLHLRGWRPHRGGIWVWRHAWLGRVCDGRGHVARTARGCGGCVAADSDVYAISVRSDDGGMGQ